jgi:hypothetical protein
MAVATTGIVVQDRLSIGDSKNGSKQIVTATVTFTGSYATAGEVPTGSTWEAVLGMDRISGVYGYVGEGGPPPTLLLVAYWNPVTDKLQLFTSNGAGPASLAEKTAAAYGTAPTGQLTFLGR